MRLRFNLSFFLQFLLPFFLLLLFMRRSYCVCGVEAEVITVVWAGV